MTAPCTEVLRVLPCDPDGAQRESLASLIIRTARENDASPAILLERKFSSGALDGLRCSARALGASVGQSINGCGHFSQLIVERSEQLTQLTNLRASTTAAFSPFATINGLLKRKLAWSPDALRSQKAPYYPLLWALEPVRACSVTRQPLVSLCPKCRKPLGMLTGGSSIAKCNYCHAGLADCKIAGHSAADPVSGVIKCLDYELWIAEQFGEFIRYQTRHTLPADFNYGDTLTYWFEKFELSKDRSSAGCLGVSQQAIGKWLGGQATPRLRLTINLCWVFGLSLVQFLTKEVPKGHDGKLRPSMEAGMRHNAPSRRRRIEKPILEKDLKAVLRQNKYATLSFTEICEKKLDRNEMVVREYFPDLARAIAKRFLESRKFSADVKRDQYCTAIHKYAKFLHSRGIVPNHKTLSQYVERPSLLRCVWAIAALREVRIELGYENEAEQLLLPMGC